MLLLVSRLCLAHAKSSQHHCPPDPRTAGCQYLLITSWAWHTRPDKVPTRFTLLCPHVPCAPDTRNVSAWSRRSSIRTMFEISFACACLKGYDRLPPSSFQLLPTPRHTHSHTQRTLSLANSCLPVKFSHVSQFSVKPPTATPFSPR